MAGGLEELEVVLASTFLLAFKAGEDTGDESHISSGTVGLAFMEGEDARGENPNPTGTVGLAFKEGEDTGDENPIPAGTEGLNTGFALSVLLLLVLKVVSDILSDFF